MTEEIQWRKLIRKLLKRKLFSTNSLIPKSQLRSGVSGATLKKGGDEVNASEDTAKRDCGIKKKYNSIKKIKEQ